MHGVVRPLGQRAGEISGRVALESAGGDGVPEHAAAILQCTMRGFVCAAGLDSTQTGEQFHRGDAANRSTADPGEDVAFQAADDLAAMSGRPSRRMHGEPFAGHGLEAILDAAYVKDLRELALFSGIDAGLQLLAGFFALLARLF